MIPGLEIPGEFAAGALLAVVVLLILTGRLVPRSFVQDKIDEAKDWKKAHDNLEKVIKEQTSQLDKALEGQRYIVEVIEAFRKSVE